MRYWFITGISRGLGRAMAAAALAQGDMVIGTVRSGGSGLGDHDGRLIEIRADLADPVAACKTVATAFARVPRLDVIVNNAGYGQLGAVEQSTDAELADLFAVDVFAPIRIIRTAIPYLRQQGSGHIINITSIAGRAPGSGAALYAAAKAAIEGLSAALASELAPFGIKVTAVAPGQFRTDFLSQHSLRKSASEGGAYARTIGAAVQALESTSQMQLGDPAAAARVILDLVASDDTPLHLLLGSDALDRFRAKADRMAAEIAAWEAATLSTDFPA